MTDASADSWTIWMTGLPGAGKTTLARAQQQRLRSNGVAAVVLDSDALRPVLAPAAGYSAAARDQFYRQIVTLAGLLNQEGANVIIAATAHRRAYRAAARAALAPFAEVWVRCPRDVCAERDPKGLYAQAAAGAISNLPGMDIPYEPPQAPEAIIDTDQTTVEAGFFTLRRRRTRYNGFYTTTGGAI
jgi:adenylylsulfate kinase